jgi:CheY-like chemotaxis protein
VRILAVDDEPYILELMPLLAARIGFPNVTGISSARTALERLASDATPFECLVLDVNMPEMDGIELCARVRQLPVYRKTPIIMLTAMSELEFMEAAFRAGATDYATKPFDINELGARLRVAQELVLARQQAEEARVARTAQSADRPRHHAFDLSEAIAVGGLRDLVDFDAFKNYLKQSSRAGLAASQIFAVGIDRIERLYDRAGTDEFLYALRAVALAINGALRNRASLMAYAGQGRFIVVSNSVTALDSAELEVETKHLLDEKDCEYDDGTPMDLEVSIGNPIQPDFGDLGDVPKSVERALARAESRAKAKQDQPRPVNIRQIGF